MSQRHSGLVYVGYIIKYLLYLPDPIRSRPQREQYIPNNCIIDAYPQIRIGYSLIWWLFNCITMWQGSWTSALALYMEVGWHCTIAASAWCSAHQLLRCECAVKRSCAPLGHLNAACMSIYGHIQQFIHAFEYIYKFQYINISLLTCLVVFFMLLYSYIRIYIHI